MGRVSTCQKNCNTIDLRRAQVNKDGAIAIADREQQTNRGKIFPFPIW